MIKKVHKINWTKKSKGKEENISFEVIDIDCIVTQVSHPSAQWAIGEYWHRVCTWFIKKHAQVTLGEQELIN